ncbi:MAG: ParA family protein [Bacteroidota bacterium]
MIIAITNLKGGVGKSTLSRNIAVYFASQGIKTCIIDTDIEQRTTCDWRNRRINEELALVDVFPMSSTEGLVQDVNTHKANGYRVIILDGVPQLEEVTTKMILLSNFLIIPITPSIDDLKSFERFLKRFEATKIIRPNIPAFLALNRYSKTGEAEEMKSALNLFSKHGITALNSVISERVAHKRSSKYGLSALEWTDEKAKNEILALCQEIETQFTNQNTDNTKENVA